MITIRCNYERFEIHKGIHPVAEVKKVCNVPAAYELEIVLHGQLTALPDDGTVDLTDHEHFIAHPRCGAVS